MRKLSVILTTATAIALFASPAPGELETNNPTDAITDAAGGGSGIRHLDHAANVPV
jgi:hypothetical protein